MINQPIPYEEIVQWRRHFHANPELSFKEFETSKKIAEILTSFGLQPEHPTPTSVTAVIKGQGPKAANGPTVAWRADIDALPLQEETGEPFTSKVDGVMHGCGHDAHTAMALGIAKVLTDNLDKLNGKVKMVFQHAEELNPGGAIEMVKAGVVDDVDGIYGIHVMNQPVGSLHIHKGPASTSAGGCFVKIVGQGGHGSMPHKSIDPLICGAHMITALYTITSRNTDPDQMNIVNIGTFKSGDAANIIPDTAEMIVSLRSGTNEGYETLRKRTQEILDGTAAAFGCKVEVNWVETYPVVVNNEELCDIAYEASQAAIGEQAQWGPGTTASEDFAHFANKVPGCFMFLGAGTKEDGLEFMNHHPKFNIVEKSMEYGVKAGIATLTGFLNTKTS